MKQETTLRQNEKQHKKQNTQKSNTKTKGKTIIKQNEKQHEKKKTKYTNKTFCFICVFSIYFQKNKMKNHTEK